MTLKEAIDKIMKRDYPYLHNRQKVKQKKYLRWKLLRMKEENQTRLVHNLFNQQANE